MGIPLESTNDDSLSSSADLAFSSNSSNHKEKSTKHKQGARNNRSGRRFATDSIGFYLSSIGRVPLLTAAEEIELAHHVQKMKQLLEVAKEKQTQRERHQIRMGKRARDRMMAANLRLVVSVAKKYQNQGLELLDLVQEGAIGLERAVDKFDPAMGYKFSTYA